MKSSIFIKYENIANRRYFKEKNIARKFVIFLSAISLFTIILLEFLIFLSLFHNFKTLDIPQKVYITLISFALLIIFYITFISNFSQAMSAFVVRKKEEFLLSLPLSTRDLVNYRFIKSFLISSMIIVIFSFPLIYSYFYVYNYNFIYYFLIVIPFLITSFLITSLVFFIISLISAIFKRFNMYYISIFFYIIFFILGFLLIIYYLPDFKLIYKVVKISQFVNIFSSRSQIIYSPEKIITNMSLNINYSYNLLVLFIESLILFSGFQFLIKYSKIHLSRHEEKSFWKFNFHKYYIISKDLNHFISEELKILNSGIILFIFFIIIYIISYIGKFNAGVYYNFIFSAFCITFGYLMILFGLYFIFPTFSQEGQSGWIIFSSPVTRKSIFNQKNMASLVFMLLHAMVIAAVLSILFNMNIYYFLYFLNFAFFVTVGISILFTSLGTAYPNFSKRNIQDLSTTPSGLLSTIISIFYIFIPIYIFYQFGFFVSILTLYLIFIVLLAIFIPLGSKKINTMDFSVRN